MSARELATVLDGVVDALLDESWVAPFDDLSERRSRIVDAHVAIITAFAEAVGASFRVIDTATDPDVFVRGRLERQFESDDLDAGKLRFYVGRGLMAIGEEGRHILVANVWDLWLPQELCRRGYGRCLLAALMRLWRALDVEEVRANVVTDAGRAAFGCWGFTRGEDDSNGHTPYSLPLVTSAYDVT